MNHFVAYLYIFQRYVFSGTGIFWLIFSYNQQKDMIPELQFTKGVLHPMRLHFIQLPLSVYNYYMQMWWA